MHTGEPWRTCESHSRDLTAQMCGDRTARITVYPKKHKNDVHPPDLGIFGVCLCIISNCMVSCAPLLRIAVDPHALHSMVHACAPYALNMNGAPTVSLPSPCLQPLKSPVWKASQHSQDRPGYVDVSIVDVPSGGLAPIFGDGWGTEATMFDPRLALVQKWPVANCAGAMP